MDNSHDSEALIDHAFENVPIDIWFEILLVVDTCSLKSCRFVNKTFYSIIDSQIFWHKRCIQCNIHFPKQEAGSACCLDYRMIYFKKPYGRNLIKNPNGEDGFQHWTVVQSGGNEFKVERPPAGVDPAFDVCFATSYYWCIKEQLVDLGAAGCDPRVLDEMRPKIIISEWFAARFDCASIYILRAFLLRDKPGIETKDFSLCQEYEHPVPDWGFDNRHRISEADNTNIIDTCCIPALTDQWAGGAWKQVTHEFTNYGKGVRFVLLQSLGKDMQFWNGWYGPKTTQSSVFVSIT